MVADCTRIENTVKQFPGMTISKLMMQLAATTPEDMAKATETTLEYDAKGNPRFMPKDAKAAAAMRALWEKNGKDGKVYDAEGRVQNLEGA